VLKLETHHDTRKLRTGRGGLVVIGPGREYYWGRGASSKRIAPADRGPSSRSLVTAVAVGVMACELAEYRHVTPIVSGSDGAGYPDFALAAIAARFRDVHPLDERHSGNTGKTSKHVAAILLDEAMQAQFDEMEVVVCSDWAQGHNLARGLTRAGLPVTGIAEASSIVLNTDLLTDEDEAIIAARCVVNDPWAPLEASKQRGVGLCDRVDRQGLVVNAFARYFRPPVEGQGTP
jgi:hypothetical protein